MENVMIKVATDKHTKLVARIYKLKEEQSQENFESVLNLVNSIYLDEVQIIASLQEAKVKDDFKLSVPAFMMAK